MKTIYLYTIMFVVFAVTACKKTELAGTQLAAINVVNASLDLTSVKVNPSDKPVYWRLIADQVNYGSNKFYYAPMGNATFKGVSIADTTKIVFNSNFNLTGKVYTIYLLGNVTAVEPVLVEEANFPYIRMDQPRAPSADSVVNVRFANLSTNSPMLKVNLQNLTNTEFNNLSYKTVSNWKAYPNKTASTNYVFEIRNAATNELLFTYTFAANSGNLFRSVALVVKGVYGTTTGPNSFNVSVINYF